MVKPQTLKGFRDFLPEYARKRQYVINTLKKMFESYGFEPLETPALEYEEILNGKYGEEGDKLMYRFTDRGDRKVAMRYDQTVPLARVVAQYGEKLPMPFKRYQIQNVWRADNTQKGRYREFLQCDADIVGTDSPLSDAEMISVTAKSLEKLGFKKFKILINDREILKVDKTSLLEWINASKLSPEEINKQDAIIIRALDKLKKTGESEVINEIINKTRYSEDQAKKIINDFKKAKATQRLKEVIKLLQSLNVSQDELKFFRTLARGLDYYTSTIFEIEIDGYSAGSVCGGGRYDDLIGMFAGRKIPAVGFAFGFDRLMEAMDELDLFPADIQSSTTKVLVTVFPASNKEEKEKLLKKSLSVASDLRNNGINTEVYLESDTKMEKQLKYADKKGIPYTIIIGPDEASKNSVTVRDMKTREQKSISAQKVLSIFPFP